MDAFTKRRLTHLLTTFREKHGRDISFAELAAAKFSSEDVRFALRHALIARYQVTADGGRTENRYRLKKSIVDST